MPAATAKHAIELVKASIERIRRAKAAWLALEADPKSNADKRWQAKRWFKDAEAEFAWQWENVESILQEKGE